MCTWRRQQQCSPVHPDSPLCGLSRTLSTVDNLSMLGWYAQEEDLLDAFGPFKAYKRRGLDAQLAFFRATDLPADLRAWAFQLCRTNMKVQRWLRQQKYERRPARSMRFGRVGQRYSGQYEAKWKRILCLQELYEEAKEMGWKDGEKVSLSVLPPYPASAH